MRKLIIAALTATSLTAAPTASAADLPPLNEVAEIDDALFDLGIADIIRKNCPTISARMFRAIGFLYDVQKRASALGYSDAQIDAYTDSDADKARLRAKAADFFEAKGVDTSDPQSYCALGLAEIQKASRIGSLLRAK